MTFTITVKRNPGYVRYDVAGLASLKSFADLVVRVSAETEQFEDDRVLLDLRKIENKMSSSEQHLVGEMAAARLPLLFKLASIVRPGDITRNSERAAVSRGLQVQVFDAEPPALDWLLHDH